jgi:hypothetical protein
MAIQMIEMMQVNSELGTPLLESQRSVHQICDEEDFCGICHQAPTLMVSLPLSNPSA